MVRIFLSSTFRDLKNDRRALISTLDRRHHVVGMEKLFARSEPPLNICLEELSSSDLVILAVGNKYGSIHPDLGISYTEAEYREAKRQGIPLIVLVKTDRAGLWRNAETEPLKRDLLDQFKATVQDETWVRFYATQAKLVEEVLISLLEFERREGAVERLGRTFLKTGTFFGEQLTEARIYNHSRPLIGRVEALSRVLTAVRTPSNKLVVQAGHGGSGKTRLLLEAARTLEEDDGMSVRWVRDSALIDNQAVRELPAGSVTIFCDDAHRRDDLHSLFQLTTRAHTSIVIGIRPWGSGVVDSAAVRAGVPADGIVEMPVLSDLSFEDLVQLTREELGPDYSQYAEQLAHLAPESPAVALVAARLLRERQLAPSLLATDELFRREVLDRFQNEVLGTLAPQVDESLARDLLRLISAIGPIQLQDEKLIGKIAAFLSTPEDEVRSLFDAMEKAGILRSARDEIRIIPDVLADAVLSNQVIGANGRYTGYDKRVLEEFGPIVLPHLLRNLAELDWRLRQTDVLVDAFGHAWEAFLAHYRTADEREQRHLLQQLRLVALFQPVRVLPLCEEVWANPASSNEESTLVGSVRVIDQLPNLLAGVAFHKEYASRALDLLWEMAKKDSRDSNNTTDHPIRIIEAVVGYYPGRDLWVQANAVEALERWTEETGWSEHKHSPLIVAKELLKTAIIRDVFRDDAFSLSRVGIRPQPTMPIRERVLTLLGDLALDEEPKGRLESVNLLVSALDLPDQSFGYEVTFDEERSWQPQYEAALTQLERVIRNSSDPLIKVEISDSLWWVRRRTRIAEVATRTTALRKLLRPNSSMRLVRALAQRPPSDWGVGSHARQLAKLEQITVRAAADLIRASRDQEAVLAQRLSAACANFDQTGTYRNVYPLLYQIARQRPPLAVALAQHILNTQEGTDWLPRLLADIRSLEPSTYAHLLRSSAISPLENLRTAASQTLRIQSNEADLSVDEKGALLSLLSDISERVRQSAVTVLGGFHLPVTTLEGFLPAVRVRGSTPVANALATAWWYRGREHSIRISENAARALLTGLLEIPRLDGEHTHDFEPLISDLATQWPHAVVEFLAERVRREAGHYGDFSGNWFHRYDAVPYGGWHTVWTALRHSSAYPDVVKALLDSITAGTDWERWKLADLFAEVTTWDDTVQLASREWIADADCANLGSFEFVLRRMHNRFVVEANAFVVEVISKAESCGPDVLDQISDALAASAGGNFGSNRTLNVEVRDGAAMIIARLPRRSAARRLYQRIRREAQERLARGQQEPTEG